MGNVKTYVEKVLHFTSVNKHAVRTQRIDGLLA
jgi:hypothetical protein